MHRLRSPVRLLLWPVRVHWRILTSIRNLARRRISVQLILSQVLVVLLTALLVEIVAIVVLWGLFRQTLDESSSERNAALGVSARVVASTIDDEVEATVRGDEGGNDLAEALRDFASSVRRSAGDESASTEESKEQDLTTMLGELLTGRSARQDCFDQIGRLTTTLPLCGVEHVVVVDATGTIIASTDESWARPDDLVSTVPFTPVIEATRRVLERRGEPAAPGETEVTVLGDEGPTAAAAPIFADDETFLGVVALQGRSLAENALPGYRALAVALLGVNAVVLPVLAIPALFVAIPVGILRARAVSHRLSRLADAADAMAAGDLDRRVVDTGADEIARLSERFNGMSARLAESARERRAFVANVSHDLRTPLAIIRGHVERLLEAPPNESGTTTTAELSLIHRETLTLGRLIDDLFTLARLEEAMLPVEPKPVRIQHVVKEAADGLRPLAWDRQRVSVETVVAADLRPALADETRVRQIINNLLFNALRHTPEGGLIVVEAGEHPESGQIEIAVTDTGPGIPAAELTSIFERFYRGQNERKLDRGSGLGLHIVKQLVEAQGGTIVAESRPGTGATFRFTLPPVESADATVPAPARSSVGGDIDDRLGKLRRRWFERPAPRAERRS